MTFPPLNDFPFGFIEAASRAIVQFLEINQSEEASRGWMLLTTINLLASSGQVKFLVFMFDNSASLFYNLSCDFVIKYIIISG